MDKFVFDGKQFPDWFNKQCKLGRAKLTFDENNNVNGCLIFTPVKNINVKIGDTVTFSKSGLYAIPKPVKQEKKNVNFKKHNKQTENKIIKDEGIQQDMDN